MRLLERLEALYAVGGGVGANRPAYSEAEDDAHRAVAGWMEEAGLEIERDPAGNLLGRLRGERPELTEVWTGSHLDSVPEGGRFDGPLGVLAGVESSMTVAQEEIFGPVVTVIPFEDEKDAIQIANDVRYGLMATVWTGDPARGHRLASRIKAGTVGINMPYTAFPGIPFGGYKQSGFGRELGLETLELYLETKSVLVSTSTKPFNPFGL